MATIYVPRQYDLFTSRPYHSQFRTTSFPEFVTKIWLVQVHVYESPAEVKRKQDEAEAKRKQDEAEAKCKREASTTSMDKMVRYLSLHDEHCKWCHQHSIFSTWPTSRVFDRSLALKAIGAVYCTCIPLADTHHDLYAFVSKIHRCSKRRIVNTAHCCGHQRRCGRSRPTDQRRRQQGSQEGMRVSCCLSFIARMSSCIHNCMKLVVAVSVLGIPQHVVVSESTCANLCASQQSFQAYA